MKATDRHRLRSATGSDIRPVRAVTRKTARLTHKSRSFSPGHALRTERLSDPTVASPERPEMAEKYQFIPACPKCASPSKLATVIRRLSAEPELHLFECTNTHCQHLFAEKEARQLG
jgi:hypothetical protein